MRTDVEIKEDVLDELAWQPDIDETEIGVIVENGVVTLSGVVDSYSKKLAAEKAVKRVKGVRAIAEDLEVKYGISYKKTDKEVAKAGLKALEWNSAVPDEDIKELKTLIENHQKFTSSTVAAEVLANWDESLKQFVKVMPTDYKRVLEEMKKQKAVA